MPYIIKSWLIFTAQIAAAVLIIVLLVKSYKYVRALFKRAALMRSIRAICRKNGCTCIERNVYSSVFGRSNTAELTVVTDKKTYAIKFFACLKYKDTYTLSDLTSFTTTNNARPILLSFGIGNSGMVFNNKNEQQLALKRIVKADGTYINAENSGSSVIFPDGENTEKILCINPISVEINVVRTNRPERIFDGEKFMYCTVYSGKALCEMLDCKNPTTGKN